MDDNRPPRPDDFEDVADYWWALADWEQWQRRKILTFVEGYRVGRGTGEG